jgi:hypothetical protein
MFNLSSIKKGLVPALRSILLKCSAALFTGFLICFTGESESIMDLIHLPGFEVALIVSSIIALIAIEHVSYSTKLLHRRHPTYDQEQKKIRYQVLHCLIAPFLLIFTLASIYYACHGIFILNTMWLTNHGWQIFIMLLLLNVSHNLRGILKNEKVAPIPPTVIGPTLAPYILYANHQDRVNHVYRNDGSCNCDFRSLKDLFKDLDPNAYMLNPFNCIIRWDNINKAFDLPNGKVRVELISPAGLSAVVSRRQRRFYLGYF